MSENALLQFFSHEAGQRRRNWLDAQLRQANNALRYYLGPTGAPNKLRAVGNALNYTDAGDYQAAADASRNLWNDPSIGTAVDYATAAGALAIPFVGARMMDEGIDVAGDAWRSMTDDTRRFVADESGAILPGSSADDLERALREKYDGLEVSIGGNANRGYTVNKIVVPEQGQGVGSAAMTDIVDTADAQGARVALTPSDDFGGDPKRLRAFYERFGFIPNKGQMRDFEISEDMYRLPQASTNLTPAQAQAQEILDLLKQGRADEVTDDMMAAADDLYLFENYDLPMDEASRMARAREMGFNAARRSQSEETPFNDVDYAMFSGRYDDPLEELDHLENYGPGQWLGRSDNAVEDFQRDIVRSIRSRGIQDEYQTTAAALAREASPERMVDSAGMWDAPDVAGPVIDDLNARGIRSVRAGDGIVSWDTRDIRSRFARFDPRLSHLRNLNAGIAGAAVVGTEEERKEEILNYLGIK